MMKKEEEYLCGENEMDGIEKGQSSITEMGVFHGLVIEQSGEGCTLTRSVVRGEGSKEKGEVA